MGEITGITWATHTFNPWIGCTKVSQGCKLCYAETQNARYQWNPAGWGHGVPRKLTSAANWRKPLKWAMDAQRAGVLRRVFCASLADVFDPEASGEWRNSLWLLIEECEHDIPRDIAGAGLEWLLLTKRPEWMDRMLPEEWLEKPPDYVRIGVTCETQEDTNIRSHYLNKWWKGKTFWSVEPMLTHVKFPIGKKPDWVIVGGESGAGCRPMSPDWARSLRDDCKAEGIPFFFKQMGGFPDKRHDPAGWPEDLRVQEFPK